MATKKESVLVTVRTSQEAKDIFDDIYFTTRKDKGVIFSEMVELYAKKHKIKVSVS